LTTILQPLLAVHSSPALYSEALQMYSHYRLSWYDALIVTAAVEADCAVLYSEDFQDGQRFGKTRVKNPFD
jgi:predicted nucleic acid-binding protein